VILILAMLLFTVSVVVPGYMSNQASIHLGVLSNIYGNLIQNQYFNLKMCINWNKILCFC
jgi:hypothetical protein